MSNSRAAAKCFLPHDFLWPTIFLHNRKKIFTLREKTAAPAHAHAPLQSPDYLISTQTVISSVILLIEFYYPADQQYYEYYGNITVTNEIKYSIRL